MNERNFLNDLSTPQVKVKNGKLLVSKTDDPHLEPKTADTYPGNNSSDLTAFYTKDNPTKSDAQLNLAITLVNINNNCKPLAHTNVEIVHRNNCIEHDNLSGFTGAMNDPFFAETLMSDATGKIYLKTVYPEPRAGYSSQIYVGVFFRSLLFATARLCLPEYLTDTVHVTSSVFTPHTAKASEAGEFADIFSENISNSTYEMLTMSANSSGGYDVNITLGMNVNEAEVMKLKIDASGQIALNRNYPEPFSDTTTISFSLNEPSEISLILFNSNGKKITEITDKLNAGNHTIAWNKKSEGISLPTANYEYHLNVENNKGKYRQIKVMTSL